jgi:N-acetylmuramoyl-L-alanine amidase
MIGKLRGKRRFAKLAIMLKFLPIFFLSFVFAASKPASPENYLAEAKKNYKPSIPQHAKPLIILDAGHGGSDEGAKVHFFQEKKITLSTVLLLKKQLEDMGYRIILTRSRDVYIPLHRRVSIANRTRAVLFVSVHYNASQSKEARGVEVFYCSGQDTWRTQASKKLASAILSQLVTQTQAESRGVKAGNFHVIRETEMPAVLVEAGFITNFDERSSLRDKSYLEKIAKGIAAGIDKYLKS